MPKAVAEYIFPILECLISKEVIRTEYLAKEIFADMTLDALDNEDMGHGHDRKYKNVNLAKSNLKKNGHVETPRHGYTRITRKGISYFHLLSETKKR
jgi:restriction endonuclease Mrr